MVGEMGPGFFHELLRDGQRIPELPILIRNGQMAELPGDQHLQLVRFGFGAKASAIGLIAEPSRDAEASKESEYQQSTEFLHEAQTFPFRHNALDQYTASPE